MLVAGWSFTSACNLKCIHCYNASGKRGANELSLEESYKVADKLKEAGVVAVNFGGGECCLRSDFIDLCKYLKNMDMKISYTTNGTYFDRIEQHLDLFHDVGVSIDFGNAHMHDWFRGVNGTFDKAVSALEKLVDNGVDNEIVTCLTKLNCFEKPLDEIYKLARSLNVDYWRLNRFRANGRGKDSNDFLALSKEDLQRSYSYLADIMHDGVSTPEPIFRSAFGGYYSIEGDPSGNTAFRIQPNGEVSPSVFLKESGGNIKEKSVEEIMNSEIFRKIRNREPKGKCMVCPSYYHCKGGDAGASYLQYGHFNGPDPLCWLRPTDRRTKPKINFSDKWNVHEKYLCTVYVPIK